MAKRLILGILAVFVAWQILDFVIHGLILASTYAATPSLWRPMDQMKMWLMRVVGLVSAICFVAIWTYLVSPKSLSKGVLYGLIFGIGAGVAMGYGSYSMMPMPYCLALGWFLGTLVEATVGGLLVGLIVKASAPKPPAA